MQLISIVEILHLKGNGFVVTKIKAVLKKTINVKKRRLFKGTRLFLIKSTVNGGDF